MKGVYIFLADGFEDVEALGTHDVLRRGGVNVNLVSISDEPFVQSSHGLTVGVEQSIHDLEFDHAHTGPKDFFIFPGGMPGSRKLAACAPLISEMKKHYAAGGSVAAICAAPGTVLSQLDGLEGVEFTCFDGFQEALEAKGAVFTPAPAVSCGRIITGRSAGHAIAFALQILARIKGEETAAEVEYAMNLNTH